MQGDKVQTVRGAERELRGVLWGRERTGSWLGKKLAGWARPRGSHRKEVRPCAGAVWRGLGAGVYRGYSSRTGQPTGTARCPPSPKQDRSAWIAPDPACAEPGFSPYPTEEPPHHPTAGCPHCSLSIRIPLSQQISRSECTEHEYSLLPLLLLGPVAPSSHCLHPCLGSLARLPLGAPPSGAELGSSGGEGWKGRSGEVRGQFCVPASLRQRAPAKPLGISSLFLMVPVWVGFWHFPSLFLSP